MRGLELGIFLALVIVFLPRRGRLLLGQINKTTGFDFSEHLGDLGCFFIGLDKENSKVVICNPVTKKFCIHDLFFFHDVGIEEKISSVEGFDSYSFVFFVADEKTPVIKIQPTGKKQAERWYMMVSQMIGKNLCVPNNLAAFERK